MLNWYKHTFECLYKRWINCSAQDAVAQKLLAERLSALNKVWYVVNDPTFTLVGALGDGVGVSLSGHAPNGRVGVCFSARAEYFLGDPYGAPVKDASTFEDAVQRARLCLATQAALGVGPVNPAVLHSAWVDAQSLNDWLIWDFAPTPVVRLASGGQEVLLVRDAKSPFLARRLQCVWHQKGESEVPNEDSPAPDRGVVRELPESVQRAIGYMQLLIDAREAEQSLTPAQYALLQIAEAMAIYEEQDEQ